ncbi:4-coumarate--CoA ligase 1 isoform X2 [Fopius arisanus]|nr:PREDICTED: 4-coumarate--CoA ligase 1-like isoform X2 [Fopius arisanus]XP_011315440.1 PREDICTED: 4-coumarate--CoA ligase 1-like isoform X2 [Fopius arisanus]XP_011315441.1 PREDICTED: 4-coumarate--CoA ligase 1-like isoform X2 [Fopius arisanus]
MAETEKILRFPGRIEFPKITIGQSILENLQKRAHQVFQVDAYTGKTMTRYELLEKSIRLAVGLQDWGLNSDDIVSISSETQLNWFVVACAAMFLGNPLAPFNPSYTEMELLHSLNIVKPRIIFVSRITYEVVHRAAQKQSWKIELIQLDDENPITDILTLGGIISQRRQWPDPLGYQATAVSEPFRKEAIILQSSGTTGLPKGVMLSHKNMLASVFMAKNFQFEDFSNASVILTVIPLHHGFGFLIMLSVIHSNATTIMMKSFDPKLFCESIQKYRVTILPIVPALLGFLAKNPIVSNYDFRSLRQIMFGSAPSSHQLIGLVEDRLKNKNLILRNGYGMTELSIVTHICNIGSKKKLSVGPVQTALELKIVDRETGKSLGPNETGELCCKGDHVMLGYKGNPQATAEVIDSNGWLHTGDLAFYDNDGDLFISGRLKELIKYKGFQVAPAEIEHLLGAHSEVVDVAVVGKPDDIAGEVPLAFVVKTTGSDVTAEELCKFVSERLSSPKHLRGGVRFIDAIPRNSNAKILRRELLLLLAKL